MKKYHAGNRLIKVAVVMLVIGVFCFTAQAEDKFPVRPINLWVGLPPGGSADVLARTLAEAAEKTLGQKMVVINKAGGGGTVATSLLMNEKADGYTLLLTTDTAITRAPHISDLQYDPFKDIDHFMLVGRWKTVWTVKGDSQFKQWSDMVDWARKNKDQLTFGYCSASSFYFGMVKIAKMEGFTFKGVPYACDAPTMTAVLGGHVMVGGGTAAPYRSHVLANNIRILLSDEKIGYAAGHGTLSTFKDLKYGFDVPLMAIILAPKGLPENVRKTLEKALADGINSEIFKKLVKDQEFTPQPLTGTPFSDYLKKTNATYEELIKEAGLYKGGKK